MAPLPPREQRHPFLRYQGLEYTDADIADFKERLKRIYSQEIHSVQVVDFQGIPELIRDGLFARMVMEHRDDADIVVFTSRAWGRLFDTRGSLVRELILEFLSTLRFGEVLLDLDAPRLDVGSVNIPYLLARYLRRGLTVISPELSIINMGELVRLQICMEVDDMWAWLAMGPERQPDVTANAPVVAEDAPAVDEGRLKKEVQGLRRDVETLRDHGRFFTWMISCMAQLMDASGLTYQAFGGTF
ncbi:hypothetical protein Tco_0671728 [Tanacetum coccineum]